MGLFRSAATISGLTLLSRITGLARDILIARAFGAGPLTDAFWVAFRIPNLLRDLLADRVEDVELGDTILVRDEREPLPVG